MNSAIRRSLGRKIYKAVLWVVLIGLAGTSFLFIPFRKLTGGMDENAVAMVNRISIQKSELTKATETFRHQIEQLRRAFGKQAALFSNMLGRPEDLALDHLIKRALIVDAANRMGLSAISPEYIREKMGDPAYVMSYFSDTIPFSFIHRGAGVDFEGLTRYLMSQGMSISSFEQRLADDVKNAMARQLVSTMVYVPKASFERAQLEKAPRSFTVVRLNLDAFRKHERSSATLNDETVRAFFESENRASKRYWTPEVHHGTLTIISLGNYDVKVGDDEIRRAFIDGRATYGNKKLDEVRDQIKEKLIKEKFALRFVKDAQYLGSSEDTAAFDTFVAKNKGIQKPVEKSDSQAWRVLYELQRPGQVSAYVSGDKGYIVKLNKVEARVCPELPSVREKVVDDICTHRARLVLEKDLDKLGVAVKFASEMPGNPKPEVYSNIVPGSDAWKSLKGLPLDRMARMIHPGHGIKHFDEQGGAWIVLTNLSSTQKAAEVSPVDQVLSPAGEQATGAAFLAFLEQTAKIEHRKAKDMPANPLPYYEE